MGSILSHSILRHSIRRSWKAFLPGLPASFYIFRASALLLVFAVIAVVVGVGGAGAGA
jgi:hypothetical protein